VPPPDGIVRLPIDHIEPCPIQPRINLSVELIARLSESMQAGRHQPLLEVEPAAGDSGRYQIVCGEQRWRAARAAGIAHVLARLHPRLGYLERLEKQYEENQLRADLDPVEEAHCIVLDKTLRDIALAEQLLRDALVPFQPLDDQRITDRERFRQHLDGLKQLLVKKKVHVVRSDGRFSAAPLAPWRDTEKALGISESARKAKVGILRLAPDLQEEVRSLPAEHAIQISRLDDPQRQAELVRRARTLTHRQVHAAVDRLRQDRHLTVEAALREVDDVEESPDPLAPDVQLLRITDLCRQLVRTLANLRDRLSTSEREWVVGVLADLRLALDTFKGSA
jgi:ParB-like chromosome segregation protein Spo0J